MEEGALFHPGQPHDAGLHEEVVMSNSAGNRERQARDWSCLVRAQAVDIPERRPRTAQTLTLGDGLGSCYA